MINQYSEQQDELTHRLNEFSKTAHSAQQIEREASRIHQEIELRKRMSQKEDKKHQEALDVQRELAQSAKRQADSAESSARTAKIAAWISISALILSLIIPLIEFFYRK